MTRNDQPSHRTRRTLLRAVLVASVAVWIDSGCLYHKPDGRPVATTKIARGEKVETGAPIYDEYFGTVHGLHATLASAKLEERDARSTLASMLGLLPTAPQQQVLDKLGERAPSLPGMHLAIDEKAKPPTSKISLERGASADEPVRRLITVIEATANAELSISQRTGEVPERARRIHNVGVTLIDGAGKDFASRPAEEREQIDAELAAAQDLLLQLAQEAQAQSDSCHSFVVKLQEQLELSGTDKSAPQRSKASSPAPSPAKRGGTTDFNP